MYSKFPNCENNAAPAEVNDGCSKMNVVVKIKKISICSNCFFFQANKSRKMEIVAWKTQEIDMMVETVDTFKSAD